MVRGRTTALARRAYRVVAGNGTTTLIPPALVDRVRCRLFEMGAEDVVRVIEALETAGVRAWLAGGWGVDALVGHQTRRHKDLDLIVDAGDDSEATAQEVLHGVGYRTVTERAAAGKWAPLKRVLREPGGRTIDLLPVHLPASAFASGVVAGRRVPCLSSSMQLTFHSDYRPTGVDRHDVALLCSDLRVPPPTAYS